MGLLTNITRTGSRSLIFGCHQFIIHPIFVAYAWLRMYGVPHRPWWKWALVFAVHDWGYWGCAKMEGVCGDNHVILGTKIAYRVTRDSASAHEVMYHSRFFAALHDETPSMLCWADKAGTALYPSWLWAFLAYLSGEGAEYMANSKYEIHIPGEVPNVRGLMRFHRRLRAFFAPLLCGLQCSTCDNAQGRTTEILS